MIKAMNKGDVRLGRGEKQTDPDVWRGWLNRDRKESIIQRRCRKRGWDQGPQTLEPIPVRCI